MDTEPVNRVITLVTADKYSIPVEKNFYKNCGLIDNIVTDNLEENVI